MKKKVLFLFLYNLFLKDFSREASAIFGTNLPQKNSYGNPNDSSFRWILNRDNLPEITRFILFWIFLNKS